MKPDEIINIRQAAFRASVCTKTIRRWVASDGIGRQSRPGAPLQISAVALEMKVCGDQEALQLLRENQRLDARVQMYFSRIGVMG
ncbi:hypothetical protein [Rhizobium sp. Rhizsp82]|uniref:hypothetical protein n=1 Tax=Rhizobium sp. Rhizsp82 TaxID=3243057 RepID=UPI0039B3CA66